MQIRLAGRADVGHTRWDPLADSAETWFAAPEAIVALARDHVDAGEPEGLTGLLARVGAPVLDMVATPYAARAALLGVATGRAFYHHELRQRLPMPSGLEPEVAVWGAGTVPEWRAGVLEEPKYFSFFQDAPLPAFNPNHRGKWRAHELLHGANGFFWNPRMTRFEMYLGARVNELLPVVHWYGLDELFRPRPNATLGRRPDARPDPESERMLRPYWRLDDREVGRIERAAIAGATRAHQHFCAEWDVIRAEFTEGARRASPWFGLDASSDAIGYLKGHWNRTTAWSFGAWVETFLLDGVDYHRELRAYLGRCARVAADLVTAELTVDPQDFDRLRARRVLQDLGYRVFLALEHLDEGSRDAERAERALVPLLESAGRVAAELVEHGAQLDEVPRHIDELFGQLDGHERLFPRDTVAQIKALGYRWPDVSAATGRPRALWTLAGRKLVADGVQAGCPETWVALEGRAVESTMEFVDSDRFDEPGPLAQRFAAWLAERGLDEPLAARAKFEAWATAPPQRDEDAELFATLPESETDLLRQRGVLRARTTARRGDFAPEIVAELLGPDAGDGELAGVVVDGELRLILLDEASTTLIDALATRGRGSLRPEQLSAIVELLELGFLVWLPAP